MHLPCFHQSQNQLHGLYLEQSIPPNICNYLPTINASPNIIGSPIVNRKKQHIIHQKQGIYNWTQT